MVIIADADALRTNVGTAVIATLGFFVILAPLAIRVVSSLANGEFNDDAD